VDALRVWVRLINDRGGLNGHQVRLFVYDDGGDPARQKAQVQEAVDQKKVIAFVQATIGVSGPISMDYITAKRVPVIGVDGGARWFYDYPMIFPQATSGTFLTQASVWGIAQQTVPAGKTKFGTVVCAEVEDCDTFGRVARATAPQAGLRVVYQAKSSVAQPDFTAECISARNADAQVLYVVMDTNSLGRLSSACARQGYRPTFASVSVIVADRLKSDPNLDGLTAVSPVFPWFQKGTPATDEFQEAIKTYGSSVAVGAAATVGWVSAKLFEKAGAAMPEPPTSDAVLRGLWGLRDEALGGLTQPLTFHENQNAPKRLMCWFNFTAKSGSWVSTDGFKLQCRPSDESLK
jgi:branched-chain amino acid transport system substrate-binding protein